MEKPDPIEVAEGKVIVPPACNKASQDQRLRATQIIRHRIDKLLRMAFTGQHGGQSNDK